MSVFPRMETCNGVLRSLVFLLLIGLILSACATPAGIQPNAGGQGQAGEQVERLSEAAGPGPQLEITAGNEALENSPQEDNDSEGVVNSKETALTPAEPSGEGGMVVIGGSQGDEGAVSSEGIPWKTYTDETYGFSLQYPDSYVILLADEPADGSGTAPLHVVRFQDQELAKVETSGREPAQFAVEIYPRPESVSLRDWIQSNRLAPQSAEFEAVELAGAQEGLKVSMKIMLAPNQFYYYATQELIYRIIPLGEYSPKMLASFNLPLE